ncbi:homeobox-leucine zipper protein ATHB-13 isoform X2 [Arachis ipaensis]|uniref:Homeobox-leucine zipper protein n=1 Tax=Arachis hypogaea TaxID=3818 RepID=A0A444Z5I1_ARAHY|nr:homeobox-leucine zipper protein ATHB-13 isoform X2 [Arachis ipaensis]QHO11843.1 Homeobox-leucine zipper protein [Arachis hypogaea]RYR09467.1 hypothetical protein Ahy_B05g077806 [Arachis hypogaea]
MAFLPANFMLQTPHHHDDHHHQQHHPPSLNSILPTCSPHDYHGGGAATFLGKRSMSFSGIDLGGGGGGGGVEEGNNNGEEELSDDGSQIGEKKRRLNMEQVKALEKSFELGNKLEPERKMQLARSLGLQPRQIAIWFQNRRARWKTKQLERDYDQLKRQFEAVKSDNDALHAQNQKLQAQILALKNREATTESINLNKDTEGSCSNRSENSSEIKFDISTRTPTPTTTTTTTTIVDSPLSSKPFFPSSSSSTRPPHQLFQISRPEIHLHQCHQQNNNNNNHVVAKEESLSSMFVAMDDQSGFWPWLEQQHFN